MVSVERSWLLDAGALVTKVVGDKYFVINLLRGEKMFHVEHFASRVIGRRGYFVGSILSALLKRLK